MKNLAEMWRTRLWLWVPALVFFLLNLGAWSYYHLSDMGNQVSLMQQRLDSQRGRASRMVQEEEDLANLVRRASVNRSRVEALYSERLATQSERLTTIIAEVRRLARQAGLEPSAVSYPEQSLEAFGLERKGFVFTVSGSYADLRKLINSLELTDSFIILDEIGLNEEASGGDGRLRISLRLSTLFAAESGYEDAAEDEA